MWDALRGLAAYQPVPLDELVTWIDEKRDPRDNLSAAIRVYIVEFYQRNAVLP
jgi:predicted DNA-binding ribbon-helix-helix protein